MTVGFLADIHGNVSALDAVLSHLYHKYAHIEQFILLGDHVAEGPDPSEVCSRIRTLKNCHCLSGNTDRWVSTGSTPFPPEEFRDSRSISQALNIARSCGWTAALLMKSNDLQWLAELPRQVNLALPGGRMLVAVHASPGSDEEGFSSIVPLERHREMVAGCGADILVAGHTHKYYEATVAGVRVFALPSVGLPIMGDKCATYAILEADQYGYHLSLESVEYDYRSVVQRAERQKHPSLQLIQEYFGGNS
jgi:predicted phosphodiesterase